MDKAIKRGLKDRIYEKRKATALELERIVSNCLQNNNHDKIQLIIKQLRNEFAYDIHEPQARYGGLLGFATVTIALGYNEMPRYLNSIIHPVIACFGDNDPDVRYYACEALYNISKVALGEILVYFNEIFDVLCKLVADTANNVKNAADILDKLIKDIVRAKSNNYISILNNNNNNNIKSSIILDKNGNRIQYYENQSNKFFSLQKFIPLLEERIHATNTYTRLLIVSWLILFNKIPDLELISYLPSFLNPLLSYLNPPLKDVRVITENFLILLLHEIKRINEIKKSISISNNDKSINNSENNIYIPGQDTFIDYPKIVDILITNLESSEDLIRLICLDWLINLLEISPDSFTLLIPKLLIILLHIISENNFYLREMALQLNSNLMDLVLTNKFDINYTLLISNLLIELSINDSVVNNSNINSNLNNKNDIEDDSDDEKNIKNKNNNMNINMIINKNNSKNKNKNKNNIDNNSNNNLNKISNFDYNLTKLNSLDWLIMLHQNDPIKFMEFSDNIFIILLKTLNCSNNKIINKSVSLLSKISNQSNDKYFDKFMIDLLNLFKKDKKLLDSKSDFIIKKICKSLDSERIYNSLSKVLLNNFISNNDDLHFISIMIQILNNNLITANELSNLRKKLINNNDNELFENLFKCWSFNTPSLLCLTLLTSNYQLSYKIINQMVKFEININILVQLDLLIQLLESPIFAKLRLDLLDPYTNINLFKCLYGLLMLLPQSNSFKILQNRLNSISSITNLPFNKEIDSINDYDTKLLNYFNNCQENLQNLNINDDDQENDEDEEDNDNNNDTNFSVYSNDNNIVITKDPRIDKNKIVNNDTNYFNMFKNDSPLETSSVYTSKDDKLPAELSSKDHDINDNNSIHYQQFEHPQIKITPEPQSPPLNTAFSPSPSPTNSEANTEKSSDHEN